MSRNAATAVWLSAASHRFSRPIRTGSAAGTADNGFQSERLQKAGLKPAFFSGEAMEVFYLLWSAFSFAASLLWQLAWFVLRDLISTLIWILIVAWLILGVRYRSFSSGSLALLRYGGYGLRLFWRWLRGSPAAMPAAPREARDLKRAGRRRPFGTMSVSEQLNMLLVGAFYLLFLA
jgi:hypothetical protein